MSAQAILALARQGDPRAIATLMNCITRPRQLNIRVQEYEGDLHILFEATTVPEQAESVEFAYDSITALDLKQVSRLVIYGRQKGQHDAAWRQVIPLSPSPDLDTIDHELIEQDSVDYQATPNGFFSPFTGDDDSSPLQPDSIIPELLKRPEAVIFIIFVSILVFWDTYLSLLDQADDAQLRLSTRQLAQRLNTTPTILRHKKRLNDFAEWSRLRDPEGLSWGYHKGIYFPLTPPAPSAEIPAAQ